MNKKGQITIFIIVGLVLLVAVSIYLYVTMETEQIEYQPEVPEKIAPIKRYMEYCISNTGKEALALLGQQSGYVKIPDRIENNPERYLVKDPLGFTKEPYWYYKEESQIPPNIVEDITTYIDNELDSCLDDFNSFKESYTVTEIGNRTITTSLNEEDVSIQVDTILEIYDSNEDKVYRWDSYRVVLPVKLKKMFNLAKEIMKIENRYLFMEQITVDLMSLNTDVPFTGLTFDCNQRRWHVSDIKDSMQKVLSREVLPSMRFENTNYIPFIEDEDMYKEYEKYTMEDIYNGRLPPSNPPEDAYAYFHFFVSGIEEDNSDLTVAMRYQPSWGMFLNARPSEDGELKSQVGEGMQEFLNFMCVNFDHFTYDVIYPVEIIIRDDDAYKGEGYNFAYTFPVIIHSNVGDRTDFGTAVYEEPLIDLGRCDRYGNKEYEFVVKGIEDGFANMRLSDVRLQYDCYKFVCDLGYTRSDSGSNRLKTKLPSACSNGNIIASKPGYLTERMQVIDDYTEIYLKQVKLMNYTILKHKSNDLETAEPLDYEASIHVSSTGGETSIYEKYLPNGNNSLLKLINEEDETMYMVNIFITDTGIDLVTGGYMGNFTADYEGLIDKKEVVFHVIEKVPKPRDEDDLQDLMLELIENSTYKEMLKPELR